MLCERVPRSAVSAVLALGLAWALTTDARAAGRDRSGVLVFPVDEESATAAAFVSHLFRRVTSNYELMELSEDLDAEAYSRSLKAIEQADELVDKGEKALAQAEPERAVSHLKKAIALYGREADFARDVAEVSRAMMLLGAAHLLLLQDDEATASLADAILLDPDIEADPTYFSPAMREMFAAAAAEVAKRPTPDLVITSQPAGARVYVNGGFRGVAPVTVEGLPAGRHWVRVIEGGFRPWGKVVRTKGRGKAQITVKLKSAPSRSAYNKLVGVAADRLAEGGKDAVTGRAVLDAVLRLGGVQRLDRLMLAGVLVDGDELTIYAGDYHFAKKRANWETLEFPFAPELEKVRKQTAKLAQTLFGDDPPPLIDPEAGGIQTSAASDEKEAELTIAPEAEEEDEEGEKPVAKAKATASSGPGLRIILGVTLTASGVVMMGVGGLLWGLANADHDTFNDTEQLDAPDLADGGNTKAIVGDVLFFTGVAFVVGGILAFIFLPEEKSGPKQEYEWGAEPGGAEAAGSTWHLLLAPTRDGASFGLRVEF